MKDFFSRDDILTVFHGFNPWWRRKPYTVPGFKRVVFEAIINYLAKPLKHAVLISGLRRVGKTTILLQIADELMKRGANPKSIFYAPLDHPLLRLLSIREILAIFSESVYAANKPTYFLFDEIQYSKEWETEIKLLLDQQPHYRVIATNASVTHLAKNGSEQWATALILPLSFYEFVRLRGESTPELQPTLKPSDLYSYTQEDFIALTNQYRELQPSFQQYLIGGGFPEPALQNDPDISQRLLRDIVRMVLRCDMTAFYGVRKVEELKKLFVYLCLHSGGIVAHKTCADALETSLDTVSSHLALFEQTNLIFRLQPAEVAGRTIRKARSKYYFVDGALRNAVLMRGEEILSRSDEMNVLAETAVLRHLFAYHRGDMQDIVYWRDPVSQKEVDFIVRSRNDILPFEVTYEEKPALGKESGLVAFCRKTKVKNACLVLKHDTDFSATKVAGIEDHSGEPTQFLKIPAHILCYLLGQAERPLGTE